MNFLKFRNKMFVLGCFTPNQVYAWHPEFDKNNLVRWEKRGLLVKLRNGHYCFPENIEEKGFSLFIANQTRALVCLQNPSTLTVPSTFTL